MPEDLGQTIVEFLSQVANLEMLTTLGRIKICIKLCMVVNFENKWKFSASMVHQVQCDAEYILKFLDFAESQSGMTIPSIYSWFFSCYELYTWDLQLSTYGSTYSSWCCCGWLPLWLVGTHRRIIHPLGGFAWPSWSKSIFKFLSASPWLEEPFPLLPVRPPRSSPHLMRIWEFWSLPQVAEAVMLSVLLLLAS